MKADNSFETTGHSRVIKFTGIPDEKTELTVNVSYIGDSNIANAIPLDQHIIPAIMERFNKYPALLDACERVLESLERNLADDYLPETKALLRVALGKEQSAAPHPQGAGRVLRRRPGTRYDDNEFGMG